jgi:hypothetical protein
MNYHLFAALAPSKLSKKSLIRQNMLKFRRNVKV